MANGNTTGIMKSEEEAQKAIISLEVNIQIRILHFRVLISFPAFCSDMTGITKLIILSLNREDGFYACTGMLL